jgi:integrase
MALTCKGGQYEMKPTPGIRRLHSPRCPARPRASTKRCKCGAGYEASAWDNAAGRRIRKTFATLVEARAWRSEAQSGIRRGTVRASEPTTVNEAADALIEKMTNGTVRTRSGDRYKPSTIKGYREGLDLYVRDDLGAMRLSDVRRRHVQALADRLVGKGLSPSAVRNGIMPLRVIFRLALRDEVVGVNPCTGIELPANRSRRVEIVSTEHAAALIDALDNERDRGLWATAFYTGLRRGELMALRWSDVDLETSELRVERSYDPAARTFVEPKSRAGRRTVPIAAVLRAHLLALKIASRRPTPDALVFGDTPERPFGYIPLLNRTRAAWKEARLAPIGLHAARHTAASVMIAAGVNVKALSTFMGHSSITITLDRYGHLLPGSIAEAATLLDAFLG